MIFRLCELARLDHLYLTGFTGYPKAPQDKRPPAVIGRHDHRITKTAVYAVPHQPWSYIADPVPLVKKLKAQKHRIIALEQTDSSVSYHQLPATKHALPLTIVLGHEREGIRQELLDLATATIEIPIIGLGNSHNVATSLAIVLYHFLAKTKRI